MRRTPRRGVFRELFQQINDVLAGIENVFEPVTRRGNAFARFRQKFPFITRFSARPAFTLCALVRAPFIESARPNVAVPFEPHKNYLPIKLQKVE